MESTVITPSRYIISSFVLHLSQPADTLLVEPTFHLSNY